MATKRQHGGARPPRNPKPGLFSRGSALAKLDGRTAAGRLALEVEAELVAHLGQPTVTEQLLIRSTVLLVLRLTAATNRLAEGEEVESYDRHVVALVNALRLNLLTLGLRRPAEQAPSLAAYLARRGALQLEGEAA